MAGATLRDDWILDQLLPIGLFAGSALVCLTAYGGLVNFAFPALALLVGLLLYTRRPLTFLSFTLWVWMLAPLLRRMSDFQGGYQTVSVLLTAPLAVTVIGAVSFARYRRELDGRTLLPVFAMLAVIVYGFFRGALNGGLTAAALALANWAVPLIFAVHVLILPEDPWNKARVMLRALVFGGVALGLYAIVQFVLLLPWDAYWMIESGLTSIGAPFPFSVRVFSTLNTPGPYAQFAAAASLAAFTTQSRNRWISMMLGIVGLLLTLVRAVWGSWMVCLLLLFAWAPKAQKTNYVIAAFAAIVVVTPVVAVTPLGSSIGTRIGDLTDASSDASYLERRRLYLEFTQTALTSVFGVGLGQTSVTSSRLGGQQAGSDVTTIDSGLLDAFYSLGLLASVFFTGMAVLIVRAWPRRDDPFGTAAFIVAFVNVPIIVFGNSFIAPTGILFYPFLAAAIAVKTAKAGDQADTFDDDAVHA